MYVIKRSGAHEPFQFDQITARIRAECDSIAGSTLDPGEISQKVIAGMANGMTTSHLDRMASEIAAEMITRHPDYGILAARLTVSNMHKQTPGTFAEAMTALHFHVDRKTGIRSKMVSDEIQSLVTRHRAEIEDRVDYARDYRFSYFGLRTLMHSYLFKIDGQIAERPQHLWMRVALGIHGEDLASAFETYDLMSMGLFTHASPTLYNSGTPVPQLSSCFLLKIKADSIDGIYETLMDTAKISKRAGGIGISAHGIRAKGSSIFSTNGTANGLVPMLKVYDSTAHYVDQGGNKRPGAFAVYIEPWHADIYEFLDLKKNTGKDELRARNLFYGMWIPDLFMKRVRANMEWSLFCPNEARGLAENWGKKFELLYTQYENTPGLARRVVKAQHLWRAIMVSQIETGGPYMLYKDACESNCDEFFSLPPRFHSHFLPP
jgi:ribonucleotide reductase alpha subunit